MTEQSDPETAPRRQTPGAAYAVLVALWIGGTAFVLAFPLWLGEQFALASGGSDWQRGWVVALFLYAAAVALPALLGYRRAAAPRYRAVFTTWLLAVVALLLLLPVRLANPTAAQVAAALQIAGLLLYLALLVVLRRRAGREATGGGGQWAAALLGGVVLALPWLAWGALGSPLDTLLNVVAALLFGLSAAATLDYQLLPVLRAAETSARSKLFLGGLAASGMLAILAFAFGVNGQQLILLILLPGLGWFAAWLALGGSPSRWKAAALLFTLAVAAPLLFIDPDELNLVLNLGSRDVAFYAARATLLGGLASWLLSLIALVMAGRLANGSRTVAAAVGVATVALAAGLYLFAGQPGWHGERLFVIMAAQPDASLAATVADPVERRAAVYDILVRQANASQADLRRQLERLGIDNTPYYLVNALEVDGGPLLRWWLGRRADVDRVLVSPELRPLPEPPPTATGLTDAPAGPLWSQASIGAPAVWNELGVTGQGILIGQGDSGVDGEHPELRDRYRGRQSEGDTGLPPGNDYNWLDPWYATTEPVDRNGHGTHTLGTVLGATVGVAPGATWIACANLPRNLANPPYYLDCLQFLLAPFPQGGDALVDGRPELGAQVLNNSWGCPETEGCDSTTLLTAVQALRAAGVFVVASAGNDGPGCSSLSNPLALYDEVFTVGAVDADGNVAGFSSRGPVTADGSGRVKPDVVAPGVGILSAFPGGTFSESDGTSMAGPHVAGVVALMWSANPGLIGDVKRTEEILIETTQPTDGAALSDPDCGTTDDRPNNLAGYGMVDAYAAVQRALAEP